MNIVLDTGVIIAFAAEEKDKSLKSIEKIFDLTKGKKISAFISSISFAEIYSYFYKANNSRKAVEICLFLEEIGINVVDITREISKSGGIQKSKYAISYADALILATAIMTNSKLITYDKEFSVVKDVEVFKPEEFVKKHDKDEQNG